MKARKSLVAASAAVACAGALTSVALPAASASSSSRALLAGSAASPRALTHRVGAVASTSRIHFDIALRMRNARQEAALATAISTPGTRQFRHYLTVKQWEARFSPSSATVAAVTRWLRSEGLTVSKVSTDHLTISASGTAAQIERAFQVTLATYRINGHNLREASGSLSVPASLSGAFLGTVGINQHLATTNYTDPPPPPSFELSGPCSNYYGQHSTMLDPPFGQGYPNTVPDIVCGYKPSQFRSAYGVTSAATGQGVTVAVIDAYDSGTQPSDEERFFNAQDPSNPFSNAHFTRIDEGPWTNESACGASGWQPEEAIDLTAVHATAPNAHILYVGATSCYDSDLFNALQTVVDGRLANVITNSYSDTAGDLLVDQAEKNSYDQLFQMAASLGITVSFSSGDDGDNFYLTGFSSADYPSESPWVTAVGGTTTKINAAGQRYQDLGWDTGRSVKCTANLEGVEPGCDASTVNTWLPVGPDGISGGYTSYFYPQPSYQAGVVPTGLSERNTINGTGDARVIPDISLDADPGTGELIGLTEKFNSGVVAWGYTRYGGTSLASPLLAGVIADADQAAGTPIGFLNPVIYPMAKAKSPAIYDVLPESTLEGNYRVDHASQIFGPPVTGPFVSFRELYYQGPETYCDGTGMCFSRQEPLTTAPGYDSLTGIGSPGSGFIAALAAAAPKG